MLKYLVENMCSDFLIIELHLIGTYLLGKNGFLIIAGVLHDLLDVYCLPVVLLTRECHCHITLEVCLFCWLGTFAKEIHLRLWLGQKNNISTKYVL